MTTRRRCIGAAIIVLLVAVALPRAAAQDENLGFSEGPWTGLLTMRGESNGSFEGVPFRFVTAFDGFFDLTVVNRTIDGDDRISNETVTGDVTGGNWSLNGDAAFFTTIPDLGDGVITWDTTMTGSIEGAAEMPILEGTASTTNGVIESTAPGVGVRRIDTPDSTDAVSFEFTIESAECAEVHGTFSLDFESGDLAAAGIDAYRGSWFAHLDQLSLNQGITNWVVDMQSVQMRTVVPDDNLPNVIQLAGTLANEFNDWTDRLASDDSETDEFFRDTVNLINDSALFLARLRNLTDCEKRLLDPGLLWSFDHMGKRALLELGRSLSTLPKFSSKTLLALTTMALNTGALGPSAPQPFGQMFEDALRSKVEMILNDAANSGTEDGTGLDGVIGADPDVLRAVTVGSHMDWTVVIAGQTWKVRDLEKMINAALDAREEEEGE